MRVESGELRVERRLIDADVLIEDLEVAKANAGMGSMVAETLIRYVKRCPTVDASCVPATNWIPVAERLPEENTPVLTFRANGMEIEFQWNGKWDYDEITPFHVTHWMPLPKPPKEV